MADIRVLRYWILYLIPLLELIKETSAVYCQYKTDFGIEFTYCPEQCCTKEVTHKYEACCEFTHSNGVYIGASLGTVIFIGLVFLCLTYLCCKQRMMQRARDNDRNNPNTRTRSHRSNRHRRNNDPSIPSISLSVEPVQPPPYETLDMPPPYYPDAGPSQYKDEDKSYLSTPPPAYSQFVEDDK